MSYLKFAASSALLVALTIWGIGCNTSTPTTVAPDSAAQKEGEHDDHAPGEAGHDEHAGHDHAAHGPHNGHIIEIGEEEYHAEWMHDEEGKVTVYILDAAMKKEVPIAAEEIAIETKIGETTNTFQLVAVDRTEGEMPTASKFEVVDKGLLGVLESLSKGVTATLKLDINGKQFAAPITPDGHAH
ncbi:MAG: hypothetical protein WD872_16810 [Pirellulaceae bacterium]